MRTQLRGWFLSALALLLTLGGLAAGPRAAAAAELPTITMTATPSSVAFGESVTLEADVFDPNHDPIAGFRVFFCVTVYDYCDFGVDSLLGITFGTATGTGSAHYRIVTTGRPLDDTMTSFDNLPVGSYEVAAWYQYNDPVDPSLIVTVTSDPVSLTVGEPTAPTILTGALPPGTVGAAYAATLTASGLPAPTWTATDLPDGLTLDAATGELAGVPTTAGDFTAHVTASNGIPPDAVADLPITIAVATSPPAITTTSLPDGLAGAPYTATLIGTGAPAPTWSATGLPGGVLLDPSSGVLSGTPTTAGSFSVEVTASNGVSPDAVATLALVVAGSPAPARITTTFLPVATAGEHYGATLTATGYPTPSWSAVGLPPGFTLNSVTGVIRGLPGSPGTYSVRVTASNGVPPPAKQTLTLTVAPAPRIPAVTLTPASVDFGDVRVGVSATVTVIVANSGNGHLNLRGIVSEAPFAVVTYGNAQGPPGSCARVMKWTDPVLDPGRSCTVELQFIPTITGPVTGAMTVRGNGDGLDVESWPLVLTGTGTAPGTTAPAITYAPTLVDFGLQTGRGGRAVRVIATNTGTAPLTFGGMSTTGPFAIPVLQGPGPAPVPRPCAGFLPSGKDGPLQVGRSCSIDVLFQPPATQVAPYTGFLTITGSGGNVIGGTWRLPLRGSTPAPELSFSPPRIAFGDGAAGPAVVTVTNIGSADLALTRISTADPFDVRRDSPHDCLALFGPGRPAPMLRAGASCTLTVNFRPSRTGTAAGAVVITGTNAAEDHPPTSTWSLPLTGTR